MTGAVHLLAEPGTLRPLLSPVAVKGTQTNVMSSSNLSEVESYFKALAQKEDSDMDLAEAGFWLEKAFNDGLDPAECMGGLDRMVDRIRPLIEAAGDEQGRVYKLCFVLFQEMGFRGNQAQYYDPQNSYLRVVMERRLGIPISLSILLLAMAKRLQLPLHGVGFPGHFLVRYDGGDSTFFIDAYHGGRFLGEVDCAEMLETMGGGQIPFDTELLRPTTNRAILLRLLRNLRGIHLSAGDNEQALVIVQLMLTLNSDDWSSLRDRGIIYSNTGQLRLAFEDFKAYLEACPEAPEAMFIRSKLHEVRDKLFSIQ